MNKPTPETPTPRTDASLNTVNHTPDQLKRVLAKMLPEKIYYGDQSLWKTKTDDLVLNTELLQICQWIEKTLENDRRGDYLVLLAKLTKDRSGVIGPTFAEWDLKAIALARVKNVEII